MGKCGYLITGNMAGRVSLKLRLKGVGGGEGKVHKEGGGGHLGARKGLTPP